ncbi:cytochrome b5-related protein [Diabrotica virgifera virgifera]|uniref:Cytochrome b5-related protein n=1 Tax=Diabrotica virgifera virgifera TaxID=50390 RepID=A0A6P7FMF9_DIAVI|nr:cytochrome b5-related protein [Diabrotica virgifera virgifera]XP_028136062.1 cytochrome b5-related protein [Diabrotica virgifera virgifera]
MPPNTDFVPPSSLGIKPIPSRGKGRVVTTHMWIKEKQIDDGAEGLWRVHDKIYDLTDFIHKHPGGSDWLTLTKGTDITEAFEVHHLTEFPNEILKKYFVKNATSERNSPYTFEEDGLYRILKKKIQPVLRNCPKESYTKSKLIIDSLLVLSFLFSIFAVKFWNFGLGVFGGVSLGMVTVAAHNYFHMKDNFRMYYFQFSLLQVREWRISHALSHHLYTNTITDLEISMFEPLLNYLPVEKKPLQKVVSVMLAPIMWLTFFHKPAIERIINLPNQYKELRFTDLLGLLLPICMYVFGKDDLLSVFIMWNFVLVCGGTFMGFVGLNAGHHHPDVFHDGDAPRGKKFDWGLGQLDALLDRKEITGSHFLVLTNFGDHALHHFFPTLDHGQLQHLYPVFKEVCNQFNVDLRMVSQIETIKGSFQQLVRVEPNPNPTDLLKYSKSK